MYKENKVKEINLQLFGNKNQGVDKQTDVEDKSGDEVKDEEVIKLTPDELEKKLQSEADRRVTEALKTAKGKWQEEYEAKVEEEKQQAKKLAELSAEEKEAKLLEMKEQEISERERALHKKELELDAINIMAEEKLPTSFVGLLVGEDAESTQENISTFKEEWNNAIKEEMKERVNNSTFKRSSKGKAMDLGEQLAKSKQGKKLKNNFF